MAAPGPDEPAPAEGDAVPLARFRALESELAAVRATLDALIELAADAMVLADSRGHVIRVNQRLCELLGASVEELHGLHVSELVAPESLAEAPLRIDLLERGEIVVAERLALRRDGQRVPIEMSSRRMPDGTLQALVRDLRDRKRAESERAALRERLDAAARIESIGRLAGGVAHDFNNLLTPILITASMLRSSPTTPASTRAELGTIIDAAERAAGLTAQVLALSHRRPLELCPVDINEVVRGMDRLLGRVLGEDVQIELLLAPALPAVFADPTQLHQVLLNLAVNARDAMPEGGKLGIQTSLEALEAGEGSAGAPSGRSVRPSGVPAAWGSLPPAEARAMVRIDVEDTGVGMDPATAERAFEPFFTTKEVGRGTGLGLATARAIMSEHGGTIAVSSVVGAGTTFSLRLPVTDLGAQPAARSGTTARARGSEIVLLVEDEPLVRATARRVLSEDGYTVVEAANAEAALAAVAEMPRAPDVLVTDVVMPGMNGMRLFERLNERLPELRVLFLSGYPDAALEQRGLLTAHVRLLPKPFTVSELSAAVRAVLGTEDTETA